MKIITKEEIFLDDSKVYSVLIGNNKIDCISGKDAWSLSIRLYEAIQIHSNNKIELIAEMNVI